MWECIIIRSNYIQTIEEQVPVTLSNSDICLKLIRNGISNLTVEQKSLIKLIQGYRITSHLTPLILKTLSVFPGWTIPENPVTHLAELVKAGLIK